MGSERTRCYRQNVVTGKIQQFVPEMLFLVQCQRLARVESVLCLGLPLTVSCFRVYSDKKRSEYFCLQLLDSEISFKLLNETTMSYFFHNEMLLLSLDNLRTTRPRQSIKLTAVATIPNTVQLNSCNDLPPLLQMAQCLIPFSRHTCRAVSPLSYAVIKYLCGGSTWSNLHSSKCKKACNCHYKRTKYSAVTDKKRRYGRSDGIAEVVIGEFYISCMRK